MSEEKMRVKTPTYNKDFQTPKQGCRIVAPSTEFVIIRPKQPNTHRASYIILLCVVKDIPEES